MVDQQSSKPFSRAQTGIQRRFQTQKNSRQQVITQQAVGGSGNGNTAMSSAYKQTPQQELLELGIEGIE